MKQVPVSSFIGRWWFVVLVVCFVMALLFAGVLYLREREARETQVIASRPPASTTTFAAPMGSSGISRTARNISPPRSLRPLQVFDYGKFQVGYDNERRAGAWGLYKLDGQIMYRDSQPTRPTFRTEGKSSAKVGTKDYSNPNNLFERGHIVPSYAMWSRYGDEARRATFIMTNVFPQDEDLNGRLWEDIEDDISGQARGGMVSDEGYAGRLGNITVIAGPVYESAERKLPSGIPIPDACFHIIYDFDEVSGMLHARAYLIPNKAGLAGPSSRYAKPIRVIEQITGLDFMPDGGAEAEAMELAPAVINSW